MNTGLLTKVAINIYIYYVFLAPCIQSILAIRPAALEIAYLNSFFSESMKSFSPQQELSSRSN